MKFRFLSRGGLAVATTVVSMERPEMLRLSLGTLVDELWISSGSCGKNGVFASSFVTGNL